MTEKVPFCAFWKLQFDYSLVPDTFTSTNAESVSTRVCISIRTKPAWKHWSTQSYRLFIKRKKGASGPGHVKFSAGNGLGWNGHVKSLQSKCSSVMFWTEAPDFVAPSGSLCLRLRRERGGGKEDQKKRSVSLTIGTKQLGWDAPKAGGKADFYEDALEGVVLQ